MKPIKFHDQCVLFAETQDEYETLPVLIAREKEYISCWKLSLWERAKVLLVGKVYINILGHQPPINLTIDKPFEVSQS